MSGPVDEGDALTQLAGRYLQLWVEHWASSLAAPETAAAATRLFSLFGTLKQGGIDDAAGGAGTGNQPPSFRTAHDAGDRRGGELEGRIAALERRLAALEHGAKPSVAGAARKPGRRPRKG